MLYVYPADIVLGTCTARGIWYNECLLLSFDCYRRRVVSEYIPASVIAKFRPKYQHAPEKQPTTIGAQIRGTAIPDLHAKCCSKLWEAISQREAQYIRSSGFCSGPFIRIRTETVNNTIARHSISKTKAPNACMPNRTASVALPEPTNTTKTPLHSR